ncbi:SHOCT domain-containing protein [Glaciihabitans sp. dw_435]|uniref:SHOCT domain-containing protein n=1 Tax=Glaciihabitans sp. dw_435 TaxID=2720081 RepID=UPI002106EE07|nr:SHOCT domain-containing protein [Glaciihabitans sp. dw_435]
MTNVEPSTTSDPSILWEAVGQPLTRIGAGRYKLTADILSAEVGVVSMRGQQIATHEIHDVDFTQGMAQKMRGVGTIVLTAIRSVGREQIYLEDVPNFREGVQAINTAALGARDSLRVKEQTTNVNHAGTAPGVPVIAAPAAAAPDFMSELAKLAAFRDQGVLTDDEFTAAKAKLLGL